MSIKQKTLLFMSVSLSVLTSLIIFFYLKNWACFLSNGEMVLPEVTQSVLNGRYYLSALALMLPFTGLLWSRKREAWGTVFLLASVISSLGLLLLTVWSISLAFFPLGVCIE